MPINGIEKACFDCVDDSINLAVPWYMMACYAYYVDDNPILEDAAFDKLTQKIIKNWNEIEHIHKTCLSVDMLEAGTYLGEYPSRIKGAVASVRQTYK